MTYDFKSGRIISLILSLSLFLIPAAQPKAPKSSSQRAISKAVAIPESATVAKVIDGDTFVLSDGRHVRLMGIDTPEKGEPFADDARSLADSIFRGRSVHLEIDRKNREDKYGRILAYAYINGVSYNELILRRGLARVYLFRGNQPHKAQLISAQNAARKARRGIWSLPEPSKEPFYVAAGGSFRFHRPLCPAIKNINLKKAKRYKTREEALDAGLSPCRECKP
jgi:micrococcal nuclease